MKPLEKIKYGQHVLNALDKSYLFVDILKATSLNHKVLSKTLETLRKNGYVYKDQERWKVVIFDDEQQQ